MAVTVDACAGGPRDDSDEGSKQCQHFKFEVIVTGSGTVSQHTRRARFRKTIGQCLPEPGLDRVQEDYWAVLASTG